MVRVEKANVPLSFISPELAESMKKLWSHESFREAYHAAAREGESTLQLLRRSMEYLKVRLLRNSGRSDLADSYPKLMDMMCDKYPEWGGEAWVPNKEDILLVRVRTTGMSEEVMTVNNVRVKLIDVGKSFSYGVLLVCYNNAFDKGGQRAERRKWIHLFQGVQSIIYVVSLSEYDQTLFEDVNVYRLEGA